MNDNCKCKKPKTKRYRSRNRTQQEYLTFLTGIHDYCSRGKEFILEEELSAHRVQRIIGAVLQQHDYITNVPGTRTWLWNGNIGKPDLATVITVKTLAKEYNRKHPAKDHDPTVCCSSDTI